MRTTCTAYSSNGTSDFCLLCGQSAKQHCIEDMPPTALDANDLQIDPIYFAPISKSKPLDLRGLYVRPGRIIKVDGPPEYAQVTGMVCK